MKCGTTVRALFHSLAFPPVLVCLKGIHLAHACVWGENNKLCSTDTVDPDRLLLLGERSCTCSRYLHNVRIHLTAMGAICIHGPELLHAGCRFKINRRASANQQASIRAPTVFSLTYIRTSTHSSAAMLSRGSLSGHPIDSSIRGVTLLGIDPSDGQPRSAAHVSVSTRLSMYGNLTPQCAWSSFIQG